MIVTYDAMRVLRQFLIRANDDPLCGAEITRDLDIPSGTIYPMLRRLCEAGWIEWVESLPAPNAPTSHFYRLTENGRVAFLERLCRLTIPDYLWRKNASTP
jgi:DNA-binding PadR family transcriptional regulator